MKRTFYIIFLFFVFRNDFFCQSKSDSFGKETRISLKFGTAINFVNQKLYDNLNNSFLQPIFIPTPVKYFINPYVSVGLEHQFFKKFAINFNFGFFQTTQQYTSFEKYRVTAGLSAGSGYDKETLALYKINNVFFEILPTFKFKHTRIFVGPNVSLLSPFISGQVTTTNIPNGKPTVVNLKDRPDESYHLYSIIGISQDIQIKSNKFVISFSYFGLLKKYDSGVNMTLGFIF